MNKSYSSTNQIMSLQERITKAELFLKNQQEERRIEGIELERVYNEQRKQEQEKKEQENNLCKAQLIAAIDTIDDPQIKTTMNQLLELFDNK
jgi:hypothetical protein